MKGVEGCWIEGITMIEVTLEEEDPLMIETPDDGGPPDDGGSPDDGEPPDDGGPPDEWRTP